MTGGAKRRAVAGVERFQKRFPVRLGVEVEHEIMERAHHRVVARGEIVERRVLDDEAGVAHGVFYAHDRMARCARKARVRFGLVDEILDGRVHHAENSRA